MTGTHRRVVAVVAEDEAVLRDELVSHLRALWPELLVEGVAKDGVQAIAMVDRIEPDVVFLDIQMPGLTGTDVARQIDGRCHVVFVTAYDEHAVAAFEQGAVDYVLKPYDMARLKLAVDRLRSKVANERPVSIERVLDEFSLLSRPRKHLRWIRASIADELQLILVSDVIYFQADAKYTTVVTAKGDAIIRTSLKQLRDELDPDSFVTIHRSTIVNINAIQRVVRSPDGEMQVVLKDRPERLLVSEAHRHNFRSM